MTAFFVGNLDYILFVYGLGFVLLAITLLGLRTRVASPLPWKWLGVSAVRTALRLSRSRRPLESARDGVPRRKADRLEGARA